MTTDLPFACTCTYAKNLALGRKNNAFIRKIFTGTVKVFALMKIISMGFRKTNKQKQQKSQWNEGNILMCKYF